jgi:hypothetical protein
MNSSGFTAEETSMNTLKAIAFCGAMTLAGCQAVDIERQANDGPPGLLIGRVAATPDLSGPFIVAAIDRDQGTIAHRVFVEQPGRFTMRIAAGRYNFIAFEDGNRDGQYEISDPVSMRMALDAPIREGEVLALPIALDVRAAR